MTKTIISTEQMLVGDTLVDDHSVVVVDGSIIDIVATESLSGKEDAPTVLTGMLVPGFFDIQVNGGGGVLFNDDPSVEAVAAIGAAHQQYGTASFLPTLISDDLDKVQAAITAVDLAIEQGVPGVMGIHLEGPFLNPGKKGIHDAEKFRRLTEKDVELLASLKHGKTLVTLAPELVDASLIGRLRKMGVIVSAGHTAATYEEMMQAVSAGVTGFTHLYNAMTAFESRTPGVVGAAFDTPETWAGLIADGHHVHPAALRHAIQSKGVERSILVTDAMPTVGCENKEFWLGYEKIQAKGGRCTNDAGVLAGSDLDMVSAVKFVHEMVGSDIIDACMMASLSPATFMGLSNEIGKITIGTRANFVLLNSDIEVLGTWIDGQQVFAC
jgi:N-acetylglucosamine-6-phosphate deacetylase